MVRQSFAGCALRNVSLWAAGAAGSSAAMPRSGRGQAWRLGALTRGRKLWLRRSATEGSAGELSWRGGFIAGRGARVGYLFFHRGMMGLQEATYFFLMGTKSNRFFLLFTCRWQ
jgi:hypothetical protein